MPNTLRRVSNNQNGFCHEGGGHYGLGGQIIKNAKGHKKLRQRAQNSGKTQDTPKVSTEILLSWQLSSLRWISFDILLTAPSVVVFRSFTDKIKICWSTCTSCTCEIVFPENNILFSLTPPFTNCAQNCKQKWCLIIWNLHSWAKIPLCGLTP